MLFFRGFMLHNYIFLVLLQAKRQEDEGLYIDSQRRHGLHHLII